MKSISSIIFVAALVGVSSQAEAEQLCGDLFSRESAAKTAIYQIQESLLQDDLRLEFRSLFPHMAQAGWFGPRALEDIEHAKLRYHQQEIDRDTALHAIDQVLEISDGSIQTTFRAQYEPTISGRILNSDLSPAMVLLSETLPYYVEAFGSTFNGPYDRQRRPWIAATRDLLSVRTRFQKIAALRAIAATSLNRTRDELLYDLKDLEKRFVDRTFRSLAPLSRFDVNEALRNLDPRSGQTTSEDHASVMQLTEILKRSGNFQPSNPIRDSELSTAVKQMLLQIRTPRVSDYEVARQLVQLQLQLDLPGVMTEVREVAEIERLRKFVDPDSEN